MADELKPLESKPAQQGAPAKAEPAEGQEPKLAEVPFFKNTGDNALKNDMREVTGEKEGAEPKPWEPMDILTGTAKEPENEERQPVAAKPGEKTPEPAKGQQADNLLEVNGQKVTPEQLKKNYEELHKEFHKKNFEHKQNIQKVELTLLEKQKRLGLLEKVLEKTVTQSLGIDADGKKTVPEKGLPEFDEAKFNKLVEDGKAAQAVNYAIESRERAKTEKEAETLRSQIADEQTKAGELRKSAMMDNLARAQSEFKSFEENRQKFAEWSDRFYGTDETGRRTIENIVSDYDRLKEVYQTFLKANVDFSTEIQKAVSAGQAVASEKEGLRPIQPESVPVERQGDLRELPEDEELSRMEASMGVGRNSGPFFGNKGFRR